MEKEQGKNWSEIEGKIRIWKKDFAKTTSYFTYVKNNDKTLFFDVQFAKNCKIGGYRKKSPNEKFCDFIITNGFLSLSSFKNSKGEEILKPKIVIMEAEYAKD